jgi:hypothetical protein
VAETPAGAADGEGPWLSVDELAAVAGAPPRDGLCEGAPDEVGADPVHPATNAMTITATQKDDRTA